MKELSSAISFPRLVRLHWDANTPPTRIEQVWNYVTIQLRELREQLLRLNELLYGRQDRKASVRALHAALRELAADFPGRVIRVADLRNLLATNGRAENTTGSWELSPRRVETASSTLQSWANKLDVAVTRLASLRADLEQSVLEHLATYCSNYTSLGIDDDEFFMSLRSRTLSTRDILNQFDMLAAFLQPQESGRHRPIPLELYSDCDFSLELSIEVNCETFPLLRIVPDLVQKLESLCDIAQDWLRSDKVYLEQVHKQIKRCRSRLTEVDTQAEDAKEEYHRLYSIMNKKKAKLEATDVHCEDTRKDISRLEATKALLDMEVAAVLKTMKKNKENMQGVGSASTRTSSRTSAGRLLSRRASLDDPDGGSCPLSATHSSYMSRLCNDAQHHSSKLESLQQKRRKITRQIEEKRSAVVLYESTEAELQRLGKRLRAAGKAKSKNAALVHTLQGRIAMLEQQYRSRLRPHPISNEMAEDTRAQSRARQSMAAGAAGARQRMTKLNIVTNRDDADYTGRESKAESTFTENSNWEPVQGTSQRSADLNKAFRIIKNGIGHGWKDLARSLPYRPHRQLIEINNEIRAIEYENSGQLKEQAFQALVRWYGYCGRNVSVRTLCATLRELNENRLADNIESSVIKTHSPRENFLEEED